MSKKIEETITAPMAAASETVKAGFEKVSAAGQVATEHGKANVEALMESSKIALKSFEEAAAITTTYAKTAAENATAAFKELSSAKSIQEAVEVQASFTRGALDAYIADFNKVTDVFLTAMKASAKPISERASASYAAMQAVK